MVLDFLHELPAVLGVTLILLFTVAVSVGGLLVVHRIVPHGLRRSHNDVAGVLIAVVGVVYAVLLAFVAVAVWQEYNDADAIVHREASLAGDIHQDARHMPGATGPQLQRLVREYLTVVIQEEWPAMQRGGESAHAGAILEELQSTVFSYDMRGPVFGDVLARVNALDDARRDRLINGSTGLQPVAWFVLLVGSALTISFCFLFGVPDLRLHAFMTALVAASIALVIFLIVSFDYPFRGAVSIAPHALEVVLANLVQEDAQAPAATPTPLPVLPAP